MSCLLVFIAAIALNYTDSDRNVQIASAHSLTFEIHSNTSIPCCVSATFIRYFVRISLIYTIHMHTKWSEKLNPPALNCCTAILVVRSKWGRIEICYCLSIYVSTDLIVCTLNIISLRNWNTICINGWLTKKIDGDNHKNWNPNTICLDC